MHLGRVQALREEDDEAVLLLDRVLGASDDDATAYLAAVFMGGLRERQGRLDDAAAAYRAAMARFPVGHSAYVGLSEVLQRAGKVDEAREVLRNLLSESIGPTREPLWWYHVRAPRRRRGAARCPEVGGAPVRPGFAAAIGLVLWSTPPQTFRVSVDAVRVDVLVMDGRRPVGGLGAEHFDLRDSGVVQQESNR